jgi:hypothetical protein
MRTRALLFLTTISLVGCASPPPPSVPEAAKDIELSYRLPVASMHVGTTSAFQANIAVHRQFERITLSLVSDSPCAQIDPSDFILLNPTPPAANTHAGIEPPALPVVPLRLFKIKAVCSAKAHLVLSAESDEAHASADIALEIVP